MNGGHGRRLVEHALAVARGLGVSTLSVESDPSAQAFYERLGARHVRNASRPVCGEPRQLPVLEWWLGE
ncbi:GNAT family N-acetyltransferase [Pseudomonas sp. AO-1]|uniref:GNAT family N-acetyltransferase n=1 Tax=Pseudomonas sp. AO-1 TaxID=2855434 RepID=UPI001C77290C|nr:GNAT family N-acetyltransferase [Pseudomonas sp. AO-1]QXZ11498.1 GNAT family N-acetyltransferase [Pseudomonas sp. AO-1]